MTTPIAQLRQDAEAVLRAAIVGAEAATAVVAALRDLRSTEPLRLLAVGKAAWGMAQAAHRALGPQITAGIVVTTAAEARGPLPHTNVYVASHPLPDSRSVAATAAVLRFVDARRPDERLLVLLSGGGSALLEQPQRGVTLTELIAINEQLLRCGANIVEINTIRKRLSAIKGGRLAQRIAPTPVIALVLSDVVGDRLDTIAGGPFCADATTCTDAQGIAQRYDLRLSPAAERALDHETVKLTPHVELRVVGNVSSLCRQAARAAEQRGYATQLLTTTLTGPARNTGAWLANRALEIRRDRPHGAPTALIAGGETVVHVLGAGLGGRNQELALAAAIAIEEVPELVIGSAASDGVDGPTDAAGAIVDGETCARIADRGLNARDRLADNDAYRALDAAGDLLRTGPTGTNVNDVAVALIGSASHRLPGLGG